MAQVLNFYHIGKIIPENAVYIGRARAQDNLQKSKFANPEWLPPKSSEEDRQANLKRYTQWLSDQVKTGAITMDDLLELQDKDLVCFCKPKACHGDIVLQAVNWAIKQTPIPTPITKRKLSP